MNTANFKQKILSAAAKILLALYNVVALSLVVIVMIWHRPWKLQPRKR